MPFNKTDFIILITIVLLVLLLSMSEFGIVFEKSVNIIELFSLLTTVFIAVYFGRYLQKKQDIGSRNREVLLRYIDQIENKIITYKNEACAESFSLISINSKNKNLNILLGDIPKLMKKMNLKEQNEELELISTQFKEIHKLLTYYKEADVLDEIYIIEENIVTLNLERKTKVEVIFMRVLFNIVCLRINLSEV